MRCSPVTLLVLIAVLGLTTACVTVDAQRMTLLSPTLTVVAGVAMLDPSQAAAVTYDAVRVQPEHAALIAAFAVAAAPGHATPIITAATNGAPDLAAEIRVAAKRALRRRPSAQVASIPDPAYVARLVERATSASGTARDM